MNNQEIKIDLNFLKEKGVFVYLMVLLTIPLSLWVYKNNFEAVLGTQTQVTPTPAPTTTPATTTNQKILSDADLVSEIGKIINLPQGETPIIGTVDDLSKLSDQPFFAQAKLGDKILIYKKSGVAYLYDPKQKKIINVGEVDSLSPTPSASQLAKPINLIEQNASGSAQ